MSENMRGTRDTNTNTRANTDPASNNGTSNTHTQLNQPTNTTVSPGPQSLASRIQNSATGLARSAFADPSAAQVLSAATNEKAAGSSSGSRAGAIAGRYAREQGLGSSLSGRAGVSNAHGTEAFREGDGVQHGGFSIPSMSEEEFQRGDGYGVFEQDDQESRNLGARSSGESLQADTGNWKGKQRARDPVQGEYTTAWERANTNPNTNHVEAKVEAQADGAAVVSLLSDASFDAGFNAEDELDLDDAPQPLTGEEIKTLESFRQAVQKGGDILTQQSPPAHLSSLSLVPDIDTFLQQNDSYGSSRVVDTSSISLRDDVLAHLPGAEDWVGVHERYHDEVWGYLRPALEAAKTEIEEKGDGVEHDGDGPAVRRLKMILKHMRA